MHRLLPLLAVAAACVPPLEEGFETTLVNTGACVDLQVFAATEDDETMMLLRADDVLASFPQGASTTRAYELGVAGSPTVQVELGTFLSDLTCDTVKDRGTPTVLGTYSARAGTLDLTIDRTVDPIGVTATFTDLRLVEDANGFAALDVASLELADVPYGIRSGEDAPAE